MCALRPLFEQYPDGFRYEVGFLSEQEETELVAAIRQIELSTFEMRGVTARRRVAFFGRAYDRSSAVQPIPEFLLPLRRRAATWSGIDEAAFVMALVHEYPPGAPIGWHRDAPQYDIIAGVSLLSPCRMMFRPYVSPATRATGGRRTATHAVDLEPRSVYLLGGDARSGYEHHIPPVASLRYSVTFRSARR
jgi:alkylated DNA repair dioxygenase AlkB